MFARLRCVSFATSTSCSKSIATNKIYPASVPFATNKVPIRQFSRDKRWKVPVHRPAGTPLARFPWETYLNGEHIYINMQALKPSPLAKKEEQTAAVESASKDADLVALSFSPPSITKSFLPSKKPTFLFNDETATVYLEKLKDHVEDTERAAELGFQQLFWKKNRADDVFASSVITVEFVPGIVMKTFKPVSVGSELRQYTDVLKYNFFAMQPQGLVHDVDLPPDVTKHITDLNIPCEAYLFNSRLSSAASPHAQMAFVLQTPGGFWQFCWVSKPFNLYARNEFFAEMVQKVRVKTIEQPLLEQGSSASDETLQLPESVEVQTLTSDVSNE